jgi:hypothetical protein
LSLNKRLLIRKCLIVLLAVTSTAIELAILLTFLNWYRLLSMQLYWIGLIVLLAAFFVSVTILQTVVAIKCEHIDNRLKM